MGVEEAAKILSEMYHSASAGEKAVAIHLFGIKYAQALDGLSLQEVAIRARLPKSYGTEINKGRNLARYVQLRA